MIFSEEYLEVLMECPLFAEIAQEDLIAVMGCLAARVERYARRQMVMQQGGEAQCLGVVLKGSVRIEQVDWFGSRSVLGAAEAGDLFAETFACAGAENLPVSVIAAEDTEVLLVDCERVLHACSHACEFHRQLIYNLMRVLAQKNLAFHRKLEIAAQRTTREKLLTYLGQQAMRSGSRKFSIPFDRQALADYLQVDRSGLSVEIGKLKREGVIDCEKNRFELKGMME